MSNGRLLVTAPFWLMEGDCRNLLPDGEPGSVASVVTDPPYELGFMSKHWDRSGVTFDPATWEAILRVLRPGGYLVAFGGTRTYHRMLVAIEDAGFEIKDCLCWLYGSGFPKHKSLLKPAWEPIVLAKKRGAGSLDIDGCRIETSPDDPNRRTADPLHYGKNASGFGTVTGRRGDFDPAGRWPPNVCLDEAAAAMLDAQTRHLHSAGPAQTGGDRVNPQDSMFGIGKETSAQIRHGDTGGASRFMYVAKASRVERDAGLDDERNTHPTVKPIALMRWLVRLVTPPDGIVLDPFCGSGSTGCAAALENRPFVGMDLDAGHLHIAHRRIEHWSSRNDRP